MEVVVGNGEEARPKACSSEVGLAKQQDDDSGEKTLEENGVRVSENGKQNDVDGNKSKEDVVVETENVNDSGVIEDCVMNGVSSLLKLKQDVSDKEKEVDDEDGEEEEEEEEHGYQVGDFVWGKIKNHPWWPGQIYDPSEASDLALKIKQKGKLLVAYFGDGTFAWCGPSQLKPFAESFKECSNVSNSRGFLTAVEEAVEEMGRHMERLLVRDCAEEKKHELDNPKVKNAGIKEGVVVRDVRRELISSLLVGKPEDILQDVKAFAKTVSFSGLLELEVLKRKVSAFYGSKRGYGLTEYHEPESVPGLEDKNNDDDDEEDENVDDGIKWIRGGVKRSIKEKEEVVDPEESLPRSLEKCSGFPDHRLQHRRKQKSIAEILDNDVVAKVRFETEPEDRNGKSSRKRVKRRDEVKGELASVTTTTPRSRRMKEVATIGKDGGREQVEENNKGKAFSRKRKKRDVDDGDNDGSGDREETEKEEVPVDETNNDSTPLASQRKRVKLDASSAANGEASTQTTKRERKKSKYFSPEYVSDFSSKGRKKNKVESESSKVTSQSQVEEQMTNATDSLVAMEEDKSIASDSPVAVAVENGVGHQEEVSEEVSNAGDFLRLGATAEEIRDLIRVSALGTQYPKDSSSRDMVREFMSIYRSFTYRDGANSKFLGSCNRGDIDKEEVNGTMGTGKPETKGKARKDKRKANQQTEIEQVGKEENETDKHETAKKERKPKTPKSKKQGDEEEESRKESSEATKKERKRKKQADEEEETRKESSEATKKERKRNKPESKMQADEKDETVKEANESIKKERKRKKSESKKEVEEEEETLKEPKESKKRERKAKKPKYEEEETRNETEKPEKKKKREGKLKEQKVDKKKIETEKEPSGAELLVTFGPGSSLPKKEELIEIYEKFGALDEERTEMFYTNFSARVAFLNIADGEKAFESSQDKCPFTSTSTVKFRLKYPNERAEEKKAEVTETTKMEMEHLKKKLEEMISLVDGSAGGMTEEVKVKLEEEMVNLIEKVRKMPSA